MATKVDRKQSSLEKLIFPIDWQPALLEGVNVIDVNITHSPPSGEQASFGQQTISPISYVKSPAGLVYGMHQISVVANTDNPDLKPEVLISLMVER